MVEEPRRLLWEAHVSSGADASSAGVPPCRTYEGPSLGRRVEAPRPGRLECQAGGVPQAALLRDVDGVYYFGDAAKINGLVGVDIKSHQDYGPPMPHACIAEGNDVVDKGCDAARSLCQPADIHVPTGGASGK